VTVLTAGVEALLRREKVTGPRSGKQGRLVRAPVFGHLNSQPLTLTLPGLLRREIARLEPDLVHLHLPNPLAAAAWLGLKASRTVDLPTLAVWYHADITRQRLGRFLVRPAVNGCLNQAAGISVSSKTLAARSPVLARWRNKIGVIPFGIEPEPWCGIEPSLDGPFLFVGRLVTYKGLGLLLDALAEVPAARLVVVGDGPLESELKARAGGADLAGRVTFTGPLDQGGVAFHLARARALVLPSLDVSETFGLVQLEAMAAGVPVIAADLPTGVREVGEPGRTCLLVPPGDRRELATAMATLWNDFAVAREMGAAGRIRYQEGFTRERMLDRLLAWYATLVSDVTGATA
jgi:rhamnosyl/mannosyltransferase